MSGKDWSVLGTMKLITRIPSRQKKAQVKCLKEYDISIIVVMDCFYDKISLFGNKCHPHV